jgi:hypothetical protein
MSRVKRGEEEISDPDIIELRKRLGRPVEDE